MSTRIPSTPQNSWSRPACLSFQSWWNVNLQQNWGVQHQECRDWRTGGPWDGGAWGEQVCALKKGTTTVCHPHAPRDWVTEDSDNLLLQSRKRNPAFLLCLCKVPDPTAKECCQHTAYWKHHLVYQRGSDNVSEGWAALAQSLIRSSLTSAP